MRNVLAGKEAIWRADMAVGRFFYDACIPTNAVNSFYFKPMLDAISAIGLGYKGPNYLNYRTLINFLVYCPEGISFVKSVDASDIVKDATNLFQLFDEVIEWVGPLNVVHMVTDNAANYVATGRLISQKHKHINWSPCAAHCLNLIFKDIGKMTMLLNLEGWTEILRLGATRFATTFIALKSLHDHKHDLQALENFCNKPNVIGGVMDVIDQKVLKGKLETMNEMKLFRDRLGSFGRELAYSSREMNGGGYMDTVHHIAKVSHSNIEPNRIVFWM
ncbi:hypothetical protein CK203_081376 [Vitis vinifera]|uniref:DUF659 domain-containing protein n=1 Tax=Vitis vinifera TaxID=29760 RepID=A0A438DG71_VITVI|nr:hypothetical protein CK203_081376 [Vitis vinifera]